jgi:hypothetical protein
MAVSFATNIRPMFTDMDIAHVKNFGVLLDDFGFMRDPANARKVLNAVSSGAMPPSNSGETSWSPDQVHKREIPPAAAKLMRRAQPDPMTATTGLGHGEAGSTRPSPAARASQAAQGPRHGGAAAQTPRTPPDHLTVTAPSPRRHAR